MNVFALDTAIFVIIARANPARLSGNYVVFAIARLRLDFVSVIVNSCYLIWLTGYSLAILQALFRRHIPISNIPLVFIVTTSRITKVVIYD